MRPLSVKSSFVRAEGGSAAVEFALVGPIMVVLMIGIVVYGSWFLMAQSVQSLASEGARAAIGGLDASERESLARAEVTTSVARMGALVPAKTTVRTVSDAQRLQVIVVYDARDHPIMALGSMLPLPPTIIERKAVIRVGGYN